MPISAYDAFSELVKLGHLPAEALPGWHSIIGLRNMITHDYMNIDTAQILEMIRLGKYKTISRFLYARSDGSAF